MKFQRADANSGADRRDCRSLAPIPTVADLTETSSASFASHVRRALSEDSQRVHAFLAGLHDLDFGGRPNDAGFKYWTAWCELHDGKATGFPEDYKVPEVGAPWHDLVHDTDRKRGFRAFEACTMMSMRKSLRSGSAWIDHSLSFRERDQMLISPEEWARDKEKLRGLLGLPAKALVAPPARPGSSRAEFRMNTSSEAT